MIFYLTQKKKIYMIEEEWIMLIEINKVVEGVDLKIYSPCLVEGVDLKVEDLLRLKLS